MPKLTITIELNSTLELEALESALEMYEAYAEEVIKNPAESLAKNRTREVAVCKAGTALLNRIREGQDAA